MRRSGYRHRTALKRLAQDVERILAVFRQLVEKQHTPVGQRNFTGPGIRPAADQRHIGHRMMRLAERPLRNQPLAAEHPRHAVNFGHFQRLVRLEGREYGRNALGEHSLAASGRADEQQVVRASRRDLDSPLGVLLPLDVGEVQNAPRGVVIGYGRLGGHQLAFTHEEPYGFVQRRRTIGGKPLDQGRFRGIFRGGDDALRAFVPGQHPKRQNAGHWLDRAAQGKLPGEEPALQPLRGQDARRPQQSHGQRQVIGASGLPAVRRSQIDGDARRGQREPA